MGRSRSMLGLGSRFRTLRIIMASALLSGLQHLYQHAGFRAWDRCKLDTIDAVNRCGLSRSRNGIADGGASKYGKIQGSSTRPLIC